MTKICENCRWWVEDKTWAEFGGPCGHCIMIGPAINGRKIARIVGGQVSTYLATVPDFSCSLHEDKKT